MLCLVWIGCDRTLTGGGTVIIAADDPNSPLLLSLDSLFLWIKLELSFVINGLVLNLFLTGFNVLFSIVWAVLVCTIVF